MRTIARSHFARASALAIATCSIALVPAAPVQAQALTPVVDLCTGISVNESALTSLLNAVNQPIVAPLQGAVNGLLGILVPPLTVDVSGIIDTAVAGNPLTIDVLARDGTIVGPGQCNVSVDGITLDTPAGIGIGGNQINGLGSGPAASAGTLDSIAFGNGATTAATAPGAIALGTGANVTAANSVALGTGSVADRANTVSVGASGAERQITNVAAGTAATDAATVGQLTGAIGALADASVLYNDATRNTVTLGGAAGTTIDNLAPGALSATSTQAVNGSQLFATNTQVTANTGAIAALDTRVTDNTADIAANTGAIAGLDTRVTGNTTAIAGLDTRVTDNTADIAANTGAIAGLDTRVTGNTTAIAGLDTRVTDNTADIAALDARVATNTGDIADLDVRLTQSASDIAGLDTRVTGNTTAITGLDTRVTDNTAGIAANTSAIAGLDTRVTTNTSNIAANTSAIAGLDTRVTDNTADIAANTTAIAGLDTRVTDNTANIAANTSAIAGLDTRVTTNTADIAANTSAIASNTGAIAGLDTRVTANTNDIAALQAGLGAVPVGYVTDADPSVRSTTPTDTVGFIGASGGAVRVTNVAAGSVAAGSTDAVNGGQLASTNAALAANVAATGSAQAAIAALDANAIKYDTPTKTTVTFAGAGGTRLTNVAAGTVAAGSSDAVNGAQLAATNADVAANTAGLAATNAQVATNTAGLAATNAQVAANTAGLAATNAQVTQNTNAITTITNNLSGSTVAAVQYSNAATPTVSNGGTITNDVTLIGAVAAQPVALHNVAAGRSATDAVNLGQLQSQLTSAVASSQSYTDSRLAAAMDSVGGQFARVDFDIAELRKDAMSGVAGAMALSGIPQTMEVGKAMVGGAVAHYRGQTAFAFGFSSGIADGRAAVKVGGTVDSRGYVGVTAGGGISF